MSWSTNNTVSSNHPPVEFNNSPSRTRTTGVAGTTLSTSSSSSAVWSGRGTMQTSSGSVPVTAHIANRRISPERRSPGLGLMGRSAALESLDLGEVRNASFPTPQKNIKELLAFARPLRRFLDPLDHYNYRDTNRDTQIYANIDRLEQLSGKLNAGQSLTQEEIVTLAETACSLVMICTEDAKMLHDRPEARQQAPEALENAHTLNKALLEIPNMIHLASSSSSTDTTKFTRQLEHIIQQAKESLEEAGTMLSMPVVPSTTVTTVPRAEVVYRPQQLDGSATAAINIINGPTTVIATPRSSDDEHNYPTAAAFPLGNQNIPTAVEPVIVPQSQRRIYPLPLQEPMPTAPPPDQTKNNCCAIT